MDFHHHFSRSGGGKKTEKKTVCTTFYFAGIANFLLLFGREEGIKPSPMLPPLCGSLGQFRLVRCTMENTGPAA
jgi:hypothetical protein